MAAMTYAWQGEFDNDEMNRLHADAFGLELTNGDWGGRVARHSLGGVVARSGAALVGFANVIWDGGIHGWLQDVVVATAYQRRGVGSEMVGLAASEARRAGCTWLHVDFDDQHRPFYIDACGFTPTSAGLLWL